MKKKVFNKVLSVAVTLAVAASTLTSLAVVAYAGDDVTLPEPQAVYDFSYNFEELAEMNAGFEVVENEAAPKLVEDEQMGQVLKLGKAIIKDQVFATYVDKDDGKVKDTAYLASDNSQYSTINIANPYKGLGKELYEYEAYEDVPLKYNRNCHQPDWKKGITISYWIKTPAGENGLGVNSNVVGFTSNRFLIQADDLAKHLCTVDYDIDYNKLTEEEKEMFGPAVVRAGVFIDSDYYFEYAQEEPYLDAPLYKDPKGDRMGRTYWMNKNYIPGHVRQSNGEIKPSENAASYAQFKEAPELNDATGEHNPGNSILRYTWAYSEMWLDASSSFYFENDTENINKQLNPNHATSYDTKIGAQHCDSFNINPWKGKYTTAEAADADGMLSDCPISAPDEWHNVTVLIQNDWVIYYLDGVEIEMEEYYSSFGDGGYITTKGNYKPWKRFNKGAGSRYGYGNDKTVTYWCYYGNYVAPTMMEWLVKDCVNATIGGGNVAGDGYLMYANTDEIELKNVVFYADLLTDDQIEYLYENPFVYDKKNAEEQTTVTLGDVNLDTKINAQDALEVLKHAASMITLEGEALANADVNSDTKINAQDALEILKFAANMITEFTPVAQ